MRALCLGIATLLFTAPCSALAESIWLETGRLEPREIRDLCERVSDVRLLARMQMIASGSGRWRRLSRQEIAVESIVMGTPPLNPDRCYLIARAGTIDDSERRAFEVRDFSVNSERTSVFVLGRGYEQP
jgi:hypothetical protein